MERKSSNRFERMIAFVKVANQAENIALQENPVTGRDFLKRLGSNFRIAERTLSLEFRNPWQIAEKCHAEAQRAEATGHNFTESLAWRGRLPEL